MKNLFFSRPDLDSLSPQNIRENCRRAFAAGSAIGIPKIIEPTDMDMLAGDVVVGAYNRNRIRNLNRFEKI